MQGIKKSEVDTLNFTNVHAPLVTHSTYDMKLIKKKDGVRGRMNVFGEFSLICKYEDLGKFERKFTLEHG